MLAETQTSKASPEDSIPDRVPGAPALRTCIQKVATGPEYSKDLSYEEAYAGMSAILAEDADPVQAAVYFIALRMKRETDEENKGTLQAILDRMQTATAAVDELVDVADPYDGHIRGLPASAFMAPVLAACGVPAVCHGLEAVGPKYGITQRQILRHLGVNVDASPAEAALYIADSGIGWAYVDQRKACPSLHKLVGLRSRMIKRQVLTTVEVLTGPVRARGRTHLMTGYVHKAYPPIYAELARFAGFDSALIVRGVEGGIIPSLKQPAKIFHYHDRGAEQDFLVEPTQLGIEQPTRAVPLPAALTDGVEDGGIDVAAAARVAAEAGVAALQGEAGPMRDSLVYGASLCLTHLKRADSLAQAAALVRNILDSGQALARLEASMKE